MERGLFITFEGIEGCGKSTQLKLIAEKLSTRGIPCFCTREPGGTEIGKQIRKIQLSESSTGLLPLSEALLYMSDRFQHVMEVVRPRIDAGDLVLCDRYHDSTLAYQGYAREIPLEWLQQIWQKSGFAMDPDLTMLFDVSPEVGLKRSFRKLQKENLDEWRFEKEKIEFHKKVREGFLTLSLLQPQRIKVIDGNGSVEEVHQKTVQILKPVLEPRFGYEIF
jgi:dTMP kinase